MADINKSMASNRRMGAAHDRNYGGWALPSGRRLIDFVIAGGLAAPILALALEHFAHLEQRKKRAQALHRTESQQ
jgi:hypothetical protein